MNNGTVHESQGNANTVGPWASKHLDLTRSTRDCTDEDSFIAG
eukprot:CAMPEP_0113239712 /NCGR_PEP_ID=MMETSP0008_2-20120614/5869_1 /TAXON_ID=97485 /ORGANISM="Prymnesium parvum" /LENGTH=42 /DNA_ID=CAMNT_0000086991 /DNA_START=81 /DNA_END=206 /DNA_ORIENTATION=+ /assembly_acc=CAM_ASM_000153